MAEYELISQMPLKPGRYEMRFSVHNDVLAKDGSVYADVTIPDFAKAPLSLSGVVLSVDGRPAAPKDALATLIPVVPTSQRTFKTSDLVSAFLRVYQSEATAAVPVKVTVTIVNDKDEKAIDASDEIAATGFAGSPRAADQRFPVPVDRLPPGEYLLRVQATASNVNARRDVRFTIR
jgi:hypothetical protein